MGTSTTSAQAQGYRLLREKAGAVNLSSWNVLRLEGRDARAFLQGLASQDLEAVPAFAAIQTLFLNEKGRPLALAWVHFPEGNSSAWVIADEGARGALRPHFERYRIMEEVEIVDGGRSTCLLGFAGPDRASLLREIAGSNFGTTAIAGEPLSFLIAATGIPPKGLPNFVEPSAFEAWRIALGIPRTGIDFDLDRIATELACPDAISLTKGCYVGQEVVARTSNRGQVRRQRVGFSFAWTGEPIPARAELRASDVVVGYVTSTAPEPGTSRGLGMGYLSIEVIQNPVEIHAVDGLRKQRIRVGPWPLEYPFAQPRLT